MYDLVATKITVHAAGKNTAILFCLLVFTSYNVDLELINNVDLTGLASPRWALTKEGVRNHLSLQLFIIAAHALVKARQVPF